MNDHRKPVPPAERLSMRLHRLEDQIGRLSDLLAEQTVARKRRRRMLTIKFLLASFVVFAALFAWVASSYHQSQRQAKAVDQLVHENAFAYYRPRDSALVGLLPGDPSQPPISLVNLLGVDFFRSVINVSTGKSAASPRDKNAILKSLTALPQLKLLRLTNLNLQSSDLAVLGELDQLQSLDVTRTRLDSSPMPWLRESQLRWFNASHTHFSDRALQDLSYCRQLQYLQLERTAVTDEGVQCLHSMPSLRYVNLRRCPVTLAAVHSLSKSLPGCRIEWEPLVFLANGNIDVPATRRGRIRLGNSIPKDPRTSHQALAPLDKAPVSIQNSPWQPPFRSGFTFDVF